MANLDELDEVPEEGTLEIESIEEDDDVVDLDE